MVQFAANCLRLTAIFTVISFSKALRVPQVSLPQTPIPREVSFFTQHQLNHHFTILRALPPDIQSDGNSAGTEKPPKLKVSNKQISEETGFTWEVYVSQPTTKTNEKGFISSASVIEIFLSLSPSPNAIKVYQAIWKKQNKSKGKGQFVRCVKRRTDKSDKGGNVVAALEISNVDSVDKVYRIITEHMKLGEVNPKACECMRCYIQGNERLDEEQPSQAIALYNQALHSANSTPKISAQLPEGAILMKRARAYLQRASNHRKILKVLVKDLSETIPSTDTIQLLYQTAASHPPLSASIFRRLAQDSKLQQMKWRQTRYRHDMYEFALLHAARDSLEATQLLPENAHACLLAGECLAELRKLNDSAQYYQRAVELDPSMEQKLKNAMEKNRLSQECMEIAKSSGFSGDTLRLALDVAA